MLIRVLPNLVKLDQGWAKYLAKCSGFQLNSHSQHSLSKDNLPHHHRLKSQEGNNGHADSMSDDDKDLFTSSEDDKE
jgi:hypothetical protein